jgi:CBS domain-containing protein
VISTDKEATIKDSEELMIEHGIGCLPVVKQNKLIGIITKKDIVH